MGEVTVGSGTTRRVFDVGAGRVRAVGLITHGRKLPIDDKGLCLTVDGQRLPAEDLSLVGEPWTTNGQDHLAWRLEGRGVTVEVNVASPAGTGTGAAAVRTYLRVTGRGQLDRVEVEGWGAEPSLTGSPDAARPEHLGQPGWGDGLFAGLEHPGAENVINPAGARFGLPVAADLRLEPYVSPAFVVGGSSPGQERNAFWDELDRVRAQPPRLVVLANNWYQLGYASRMSQDTVRAELVGFEDVAGRHSLDLDFYCLDDPWDGEWDAASGLWGRLAPTRFPEGPPGLQSALGRGVGGLGLWVSPWGGYFDRHDARVAWGGAHGYEVQDGPWPCLCPAGDQYHGHLRQALCRWTASGIRYWKLDGVQFNCEQSGHGHPVGPGGRTAQMDRFAALLDAVRGVDPQVVLTFTTGSNPSPWWLRHADFLWRGGLDDDAPAGYDGGRHERFATYIDSCLDALRHTALPVSAIVTFSVVENQARAYRDEDEDPEVWERQCWLLAGRGTHHHDLYVAPDSLSEHEWGVLAEALAWARANQQVLARSRMVGGRPQAGEPYGFVSTGGNHVILCLRNPSGRSQPFTVSGGDVCGSVDGLEPVWGRAVLPRQLKADQAFALELEPFEVVLAVGHRP